MIRRSLLVGSVLLILGLLGAVSYRLHLRQGGKPTLLEQEQSSIAPRDTGLEPNAVQAARMEASGRASFTARKEESFDYRDTIARLRASGCSERTICETIGAELSKHYRARKAALYPGAEEPFRYWHAVARPRVVPEQISEWEARCAELEKERNSVLTELLGEDCTAPEFLTAEQVDADRRLAFLPEAKRPLLRAIVEKYPELEEQVEAIVDVRSKITDPEELKQILQRYAWKKAELAKLLSPAEYEQYELNNCWSARNVRKGLAGFNPTEAEFREIFKIWRAQDESLITIYATAQPDPGVDGVNNAIHELLGDDRYKQYTHTWGNRDFHELAQLVEDHQLPAETPAWIESLKQNALMQQERLAADTALTAEQRQASMRALQAQTENFISQQLGATAYEQYLWGGGAWLSELTITPIPPPH